ncbi:tubby C-terminal domain-like protein [Jeotgalibacillus proteolyticus]|uniref:tubby C-terminal domain-like protein n=1 Tax=Jeotgalibacillus proteolyticus TaxID=2082395 RepID=UPI003CF5E669
MSIYHFDMPVLTNSMAPLSVKDRGGVEVYSIKKFFTAKWQGILTGIMPGFVTNVRVFRRNEEVAETIDAVRLFGRPRWEVRDLVNGLSYTLQDKSMVKTHPRAVISIESKEYIIESNFGDKETIVSLDNKKVVRLSYTGRIPPREYTIEFFDENLNEALFICLLYTYEIGQ